MMRSGATLAVLAVLAVLFGSMAAASVETDGLVLKFMSMKDHVTGNDEVYALFQPNPTEAVPSSAALIEEHAAAGRDAGDEDDETADNEEYACKDGYMCKPFSGMDWNHGGKPTCCPDGVTCCPRIGGCEQMDGGNFVCKPIPIKKYEHELMSDHHAYEQSTKKDRATAHRKKRDDQHFGEAEAKKQGHAETKRDLHRGNAAERSEHRQRESQRNREHAQNIAEENAGQASRQREHNSKIAAQRAAAKRKEAGEKAAARERAQKAEQARKRRERTVKARRRERAKKAEQRVKARRNIMIPSYDDRRFCLTSYGAHTGAYLRQHWCTKGWNQNFILDGRGRLYLKGRPHQCVTAYGGHNNAYIRMYPCRNQWNQLWVNQGHRMVLKHRRHMAMIINPINHNGALYRLHRITGARQFYIAPTRYSSYRQESRSFQRWNSCNWQWIRGRKRWVNCPSQKFVVGFLRTRPDTMQGLRQMLCCYATNRRGHRSRMRHCVNANWWGSFDRTGWSWCPNNYFVAGFYRNTPRHDRIHLLEMARCCSIGHEHQFSCRVNNWVRQLDAHRSATSAVLAGHTFMRGLYRSGHMHNWHHDRLHNIEHAYSCHVTG